MKGWVFMNILQIPGSLRVGNRYRMEGSKEVNFRMLFLCDADTGFLLLLAPLLVSCGFFCKEILI
jgi:hypothetical protein